MAELPFLKMHGAGNDFVIVDARVRDVSMTPQKAALIGHRRFGLGFDQLAEIRRCQDADAELIFYNQDGSLSAACGNATRCIARLMMDETGRDALTLKTARGLLPCRRVKDAVWVNMGLPIFDWQTIPLARDLDTLYLPIDGAPAACSMGNPHMSFVVDDADAVDLETLGRDLEYHEFYPERCNVEFLSLAGPNTIRMRIWERGVGPTLASGSGSCAAAVTAARRGLTDHQVKVIVDGGEIDIDWRNDGVWMTGPTALVAQGVFADDFLAKAS